MHPIFVVLGLFAQYLVGRPVVARCDVRTIHTIGPIVIIVGSFCGFRAGEDDGTNGNPLSNVPGHKRLSQPFMMRDNSGLSISGDGRHKGPRRMDREPSRGRHTSPKEIFLLIGCLRFSNS